MGPRRIHVETTKRSYDSLGPGANVIWENSEQVISMEWVGGEEQGNGDGS